MAEPSGNRGIEYLFSDDGIMQTGRYIDENGDTYCFTDDGRQYFCSTVKCDDGYYYYSDVIAPGAKSEELLVKISNMNLPKDFNVIVVLPRFFALTFPDEFTVATDFLDE